MCEDDIKILGFVQKIQKKRTSFGTKKGSALKFSVVDADLWEVISSGGEVCITSLLSSSTFGSTKNDASM